VYDLELFVQGIAQAPQKRFDPDDLILEFPRVSLMSDE
jgi:hypothetical protein